MVAPSNDHGDHLLSWLQLCKILVFKIELMITRLLRMFVNEFQIENIVQQGYNTY